MQDIVAIVGPTASGKTALSIAVARHFGGEVVSADSMQIYREMNIGTAKPSMEERQGILHHLMGHCSAEQTYNVASYVADAKDVLYELEQRKVLPILCGGTGLYMDHLLGNTDFFEIPLDAEIRNKYQEMAKKSGNEVVYSLLMQCDPELARKLHPNDSKRVIRGLEVFEITGKKLSDFQKESHRESPYRVLYIGVNFKDRSLLYDRINRRVDLMIQNGLLEEIDDLMKNYHLSDTARSGIGYKELIDAIEAGEQLEPAIDLIKQKSRNYAKRQITWFGRNKAVCWFNRDEFSEDEINTRVFELIENFLEGGNK